MPKIKVEGYVLRENLKEKVDKLKEIFDSRASLDIEFSVDERFPFAIAEIKKTKRVGDFCKENRCWAAKDKNGSICTYGRATRPECDYRDGIWVGDYCNGFLDRQKYTFPDVPWDKSLIAPDGRLILIEGKKEKKKKVCKFKAGKWYKHKKYGVIIKCTRSIAGNLVFESEGCVLGMLGVEASCDWYEMKNYKPEKPVITVDYEGMGIKPLTLEEIKKFSSTWDKLGTIGKAVNPNLYIKPLLKRGEPIFVWDRCHNPRLPAVVRYFHSFDKDGIGVFTCNESLSNEQGTWYQYYRRYDSTLVGVPRKDWPKTSA